MQLEIPFHLENLIGGNFIGPLSGDFIENINPATGKLTGYIPNCNDVDINAAVSAAEKAFPLWKTTSVEERFTILNKIADLIEENLDVLAEAMKAVKPDDGIKSWHDPKIMERLYRL